MKYSDESVTVILDNSVIEPSSTYRQLSAVDETWELVHTQAKSLVAYHAQLSPKDKRILVEFLSKELKASTGAVLTTIFVVLLHVNEFEVVWKEIEKLFVNNKEYRSGADRLLDLITLYSDALEKEWSLFTRMQIDTSYDWTRTRLGGDGYQCFYPLKEKIDNSVAVLFSGLNKIKMRVLKNQIFVGTSYEITTDEAALKAEFRKYNFPDDLIETLEQIELKLATASNNFDFKNCMDLIRAFSERHLKLVCEAVDPVSGKLVNCIESEKVAVFLKEKGLISESQGNMIASLRHFLSADGVHRLKARADDARLSRNMMIELSLYLQLRLNDYLASS